jgi:hypothetical protein
VIIPLYFTTGIWNNLLNIRRIQNRGPGGPDNSEDIPMNGLYHYKLTIGTSVFEGSILILTQRDEYFDIKLSDNACSAECIQSLYIDPIVFDE